MDRRPYIEVSLPDGRVIHSLRLCADVLDFDIIVSIPVMQTHMYIGATLSLKDMKGCLWRRSKVKLHMLPAVEGSEHKSIDVAIADMSSDLRPHLSMNNNDLAKEPEP